MRENRLSGSEGRETELNRSSLPLSLECRATRRVAGARGGLPVTDGLGGPPDELKK